LLNRRNHRGMAQPALALLFFARQQVALETFVPLDLPAASHPESFHRGPIAFYFWHFALLLIGLLNSFRVTSETRNSRPETRNFISG
jgi:hypothetical protein